MRTLHTSYRVSNLAASLGFYTALGYEQVDVGTGFSHIPIQVDDLRATVGQLSEAGLNPGPVERPGGVDGPLISWLTDPDGYRIELVEWPPGHAYGMTAADFR